MPGLVNRSRYLSILASVAGVTVVAHMIVATVTGSPPPMPQWSDGSPEGLWVFGTATMSLWELAASGVAAVALFNLAFENWMWRWRMLQRWLVQFPDLTGVWEGTSESLTFGGHQSIVVWIDHRFNELMYEAYIYHSDSPTILSSINSGRTAHLRRSHGDRVELYVTYENLSTPQPAVHTHEHLGSCFLRMTLPERSGRSTPQLIGEYWTNKVRQAGDPSSMGTTGTIDVTWSGRARATGPGAPQTRQPI